MGTRVRNRDLSLRLRSCLVWLLCLCSWRAPVPVLHCHDDATAALSSAPENFSDSTVQLLEHLEHFHASLVDLADSHWHLHFVLPSPTPASEGNSDRDTIPAPPLSLPGSSVSCVIELAMDQPLQGNSQTFEISLSGPAAISREAPRLIPLAPPRIRPKRLSPIVALCVARC